MDFASLTLNCSVCGVSLPHPAYYLSKTGKAKRKCATCRAESSRRVGRIPSERNASIVVTEEMRNVVLGSMLGDGSLERPTPPAVNWGFAIKHCLDQETYLRWKAQKLEALVRKFDYPMNRVRILTSPS
jgi:hypothetical protein